MSRMRLRCRSPRSALTVPARTPVTSHRIIPPIISDNVGGSARHNTVLTGNPTVSDWPRLPCSNRSR